MEPKTIYQRARQVKWFGHDWFVVSFAIWVIHWYVPSTLWPIQAFLHSQQWLGVLLRWLPMAYFLTQLINKIGVFLLILVIIWMIPLRLIPKWRERAEKNWLDSVLYTAGMLVLTSCWWWLLSAISILTRIKIEFSDFRVVSPAVFFFLAELVGWVFGL